MLSLTLSDLKSQFTGDIVDPTHPTYLTSIARWANNASRQASLVLFPRTSQDIALALTFARSQSPPLIVAVRGGGHSASGASSVGPEGVVIDLNRYFNTADVEERGDGETVVRIGGGAVWATVDKEAIKFGRATVGGTVNHTGVGGLILGGGFGWLSGQYGLVIDNLVEATVIPGTAPYEPIIASKTSNPDLFWSLRGGGSNFGIVTSFVLRTYPQRREVFAGLLVFPPVEGVVKNVVERVEAWRKAVEERGGEEKQGIMMPVGTSPGGQAGIVTILFYNGTEEEGRENFKFLFELNPVVDTTKMIPYEELNGLQNGIAVGGKNWYMKGVTLNSLSPALVSRVIEIVSARSFETKPGTNIKLNMQANTLFEMYPLNIVRKVGKSEMAFAGRGKRMNVLILVKWDVVEEAENDEKGKEEMLAYVRETVKILTGAVSEFDKKDNEGNKEYANYAGEDERSSDKAKANFGENYARLQGIKKVYDPERVFMKWFPIEPAA